MSDEIDQIAGEISRGGNCAIGTSGAIAQALRDQYAKGRAEAEARIKELEAERDEWKRRAEDAEGRIGNALV